MTWTVIYKLWLSIIGPMLGAVAGVLAVHELGVPTWVALLLLTITVYAAMVSFFVSLRKIIDKRIEENKAKYVDRTFSELRDLYIANPHEAAMYINVKKRKELLAAPRPLHVV